VYNANTGELFWESSSSGFKFGNAGATAPQSSFIYIDGTTRINFNNGDRMWNYPGFSETPLVSKDKVVFWDYALNPTYYEPGHEVICVNANSGKKLWSYDAKVPIYPPAISNDLLLFGAQDGYFYALNMADGTLKWRTFVDRLTLILSYYHPTRGQSGDGYASGKSLSASLPQINNQDQIIWSVFINEDEQNRYSGTFMVLDLSNGDTMWVTPIASNPTSDAYTKSSTSLSSNTLYVTRRRTLFCLDATTGNIQWTRTYDHNLLSPIAADNKVFVVGDGYVTAYK
jgi:outer membrane protein assembly factor BamB